MESRGGRKRATVDINDVMASLSELGVPEDVQRHCYEMLQQQSSDKGVHGKNYESSSFPSSEISTDDVPTLDSGQGLSSRKNSDASDDLWQRRGSTGSDFGRRMRPPPFVSSRGSAEMLGRSARDGSVDSSKSFDGLVGRLSADARLIHHQAGRMHGNAALGQTSRPNSPDRDVRVQQQQQQQQQRALRSEDKHQTVALACPRSMVGRVIGKAGETIKALQQYTNTSIQIDQSTDPSRVTITGSDKSVRMTVAMISDIINGRFKGFAILRQIASMSPAGSRGSSTDGIGGYGIGGTDTTLSYYGAGGSGGGVGGSGSGGQQQQQAQDDDWQPTYVQGYGFIPPVSPADSVIHRLSHDRDRRSIGSDGGSIGSDGGSLGGRRIIGSPASAPLGPTLGYTDNVLVGGGSVQGFGFGSTGQGFPQELGQSVAPAAPHPHASDQILHREAVLKKLMELSLNQQQQQQQQEQQ